MSWEQWIKEVDQIVWRMTGVSLFDLPDCCYADWYDAGMTPKAAARKAVRQAA